MSTLQTFEHDGLTFDVDDTGDGEGDVVILLHGYPESRRSWDGVTPSLAAAGYRVLAPDQRGYSPGARPTGRANYSLPRLVGDVLALADRAGAERFHVVGHDWGGAVAWALGAWHPERVRTLTSLATPHPRAMLQAMASSTQVLRSWYILFFQLPWLPEASVTSRAGGRLFARTMVASGLSPDRAEAYLDFMRSGAVGPAIGWYRAVPFTRPRGFEAVSVPTMYVYPTADFALGRRAADLTGEYVKGPYRYEVLEGMSHWIPEEAPDTTAALLLEHLGGARP